MKIFVVVLRVFAYLWLIAASLLILVGIVGTWMKGGFSAVQDLMSPFNIVNYVAIVVTLALGLGALIWAENLKSKLTISK